MPLMSLIMGWAASSRLRSAPTWSKPRSSSSSRVFTRPSQKPSRMWLLATVNISIPQSFSVSRMISGVRKKGKEEYSLVVAMLSSRLPMVKSALLSASFTYWNWGS